MYKIEEKPVFFKNTKGEKLWGFLILPKKKKRFPVVVMAHGFYGSKSARKFVKMGREFAQKGIALLRFDFSGCGDSEGDFQNMSILKEVEDIESAYRFLIKQPQIDKKRIGFVGHSLGALISCLFQSKIPIAETLVLVAPALDQKNLMKIWYPSCEIKKWRKRGYADTLKYRIGKQYLNEIKDYTHIISDIKIPVLIIHGKKDKDVPIRFSKRLLKFIKKGKLVIIKNADHDFESFLSSQALVSHCLKWFKKHL